ncbi:MAG: hypothetical protein ACRC14_10075 [Paracoccaceae bacterium]
MRRTVLGLVVLLVIAGVAVGLSYFDLSGMTRKVARVEPVAVSIFFGGEKTALLANPKVKEIIEDRYKITLTASRAGSVEMATTLDITGRDCLWPSTQVAVDLAREAGRKVVGDTTVFNSPIVFYAWADVADALAAKGVVLARNDGFLTADVAGVAALIESGARWKEDLGLNIYGPFKIFSTDPAKSNSGNIWSGLLAIVFNNGVPPNEAALPALLPRLTAYFQAMGYMEASSGDIFENFLKQGMGARPIIVGYENQLVEFLGENAQYADLIREKIRVIYPEPTVFASHPLISLTPACARLSEALQDPDLQAIAWADHGFRTGLIGVQNDPADIKAATLPGTVDLVVPMPTAKVMQRIIAAVGASG